MNRCSENLQGLVLSRPNDWRRLSALVLIAALNYCVPCSCAEDEKSPDTAGVAVQMVTSQRPAIVESFRHDAALADVYFVDRAFGWAVGDRGIIWHTADGGATWRQQSSGVTCRLNSVFFINARRGWAVGGESRPYTLSTRGIVLHTDDGGNTWTPCPQPLLPCLARVKFFDNDRGIAIGEAASFQPSGVFLTQDGGATWQPLPADRAGGWLAGDFLDAERGAVAGPLGRFATLARRQIVHSPLALPTLYSFHAMRLVPPTGGWLVGDGGLVLTTKDLGHSWQTPPAELPDFVAEHFDFHALAVVGQHLWIAGSPGTRVFHSPDGGQTWQAFATGQSAPLRALTFLDAKHGWAVGDLGNIVATEDGGRSWKSQRSGGQRAALLGIFASPTDVPLELIADAGAAEGYIAAVEILHTTADPDSGVEHATGERPREAMLLAGAAAGDTAWRFPLPPQELAHAPADLLAELNRTSDGRAVKQIEQHLVRAIRLWRPEVVVTPHTKLEETQPRAAILAALILQSIEAAADPTRHLDLASEAGLATWQVKKVYGLLPRDSHGAESIDTGRFSPWLGTALADFVAPARPLLGPLPTTSPDTHELELLTSQTSDISGPRGIFSGISLAHGSDARRPQADLPVNDLADLRKLATRRRHLEELLERSASNAAWAAQVANLIQDLNANDGGELLTQLADGYRDTGRLDLVADTYYLLARRYPAHPLTDRALRWLVQFYASSEAAHRSASRGSINVRQAALEQVESIKPATPAQQDVQQTAAIAPIGADAAPAMALSRDDRLLRAVQLAEYLRTARPALYAEPSLRFAEVAAHRELGFANPAKRYYLALRQFPETDPWRRCAETEEWLAKPADLPPNKTLGACRPAPQRPQLDGQLDEPFWDTADRLRLRHQTGRLRLSETAEVRLAYDQDYLYLAVRCPKVAGGDYDNKDRPRPRDADLLQHDRVTLRIDVDRDYATAYELSVDARGWTHEACWGDATWNPDWYVAAASDEETWTVEAAVSLAKLVAEPPAARHVWAIAARRTIPRMGYQSWAGPVADADSPADFGLLIFE